jgi:hypothetical protein
MFRQLIVPKVFFDAPWPNRNSRVDVLAVDRSGSGEVHVVEVKVGTGALAPANLSKMMATLMRVPAHFKYLALFGSQNYRPAQGVLYAPDGMGRVGVILVKENPSGDLFCEFYVRPERFRFEGTYKSIDRFTAARPADIEVRP